MDYRSDPGDRHDVWAAAKLAVRRYSRNPCESTAADVRRNLGKLRALPAAVPALRLRRILRRRASTRT